MSMQRVQFQEVGINKMFTHHSIQYLKTNACYGMKTSGAKGERKEFDPLHEVLIVDRNGQGG